MTAEANIHIPEEAIAAFCRRHGVAKLSLFGSVLRQDFSAQSDVDVLVEFLPETHVGWKFFAMEEELSDLLGRRVDLNTPAFLSKYFRDDILAEAQVQYVAA